MRKTLVLEVEYLDLKEKKLNKVQEEEARKKLFQKALKEFKIQTKDLIDGGQLKIIKDYFPRHEILVEYPDDNTKVYQKFLKLEIVRIIDSQIYE
jgi:hypothetical protein